jgi:hypothetical protein
MDQRFSKSLIYEVSDMFVAPKLQRCTGIEKEEGFMINAQGMRVEIIEWH